MRVSPSYSNCSTVSLNWVTSGFDIRVTVIGAGAYRAYAGSFDAEFV
jgi:hypothetical protein